MKHRPTIIAHSAAALIAACTVAFSQPSQPQKKISSKELTKQIEKIGTGVQYGGVMIPAGDTLAGPVVVIDGALDVQAGGVLDGDAWIVNGRLIMTGGATVHGSVHLVDSEAFRSRTALVTGEVIQYACECRLDAETYEEDGDVKFVKYDDPMAIKTKPAVAPGSPSRVQYTVLRVGIKRENERRPDPYVSGYFMVDIPIWSSTHGHFGFDSRVKVPLWGHRVGLTLRAYKRVFSNDYWQVSRLENALILVLTGYEFADYYQRDGGDIGLDFVLGGQWSLEAAASVGRDYSLETGRAWSLFNSNQRLPVNPPIDDGVRTCVSGALVYDSREEPEWPDSAWRLRLWGEKGIDNGPGEFDYGAFQFELNRYQNLPYDLHLDLRGRLFSTVDPAPSQVYQSLGGYGGIRGLSDHPFPVYRGDRLVLLSGELRRSLPDVRYISAFFTSWDVILFSDIGLLALAEDPYDSFGFLEAPFDEWGKSVGLGVSGESILPYVGVYIAHDLDRSGSLRAILRIERSF
jgi:hypothetical protein